MTRSAPRGRLGVGRPRHRLVLNFVGLAIFAVLSWLTIRRKATDSVCGMLVASEKAPTAEHDG